jgi:UDP-2-acetamido-2-deoxy-ribo-hexuluronate aminotransferase
MEIPFYNFSKLHNPLFNELALERIKKIMSENSFIDGQYNQQLESDLAKMLNNKHCLLLANGTDALEISLLALGLKPGDVVAVPSLSFYATAEAVINVGGVGVFVDIDQKNGLMSVDSLKRVYEKTPFKFVIPVHLYGMPAPIAEIEEFCLPRGIKIIEDAAQAIGGTYSKEVTNDKSVMPNLTSNQGSKSWIGSSKNLTTLSFYPTKNLGGMGDAGAILTHSDELAEKIKSIRNHGRGAPGQIGFQVIGRNSRCDHFQAAIIHLKLNDLIPQNENRKTIAETYSQHLKNLIDDHVIEFPSSSLINHSSFHLLPILLRDEKIKYQLRDHLKAHSVATMTFYERSLPEEKTLLSWPGEKENGQNFAQRVLCLPIHPFLSEKEVIYVCETLKKFF